jgi:hypothetical protein
MKLFRLLFFFMMPFIFLYLGFNFGLLSSSKAEPGTIPDGENKYADQLAQRSQDQQQFNLLVISVSSRSNDAQLKSAWLISFHHANPDQINFVPLYPVAGERSDDVNNLITNNFSIAVDGEVSQVFLDSLVAMFMIKLDGLLLIDQLDMSQAINLLGGVNIDGQMLDGNQFIVFADQIAEGGQRGSSLVIGNLCSQIAGLTNSDSLASFTDYLTAHLTILDRKSGFSPDIFRSLITNPKLLCDFPTLGY